MKNFVSLQVNSIITMKKLLITLLILFVTKIAFADSILIEGFEYGNHDMQIPVGWVCGDESWLSGYMEKDHNRAAHSGNWYAFTNADDSWMFMEMFFSHELKYRFNLWAISDGEYDLEIWAGNGPSPEQMTQLIMTRDIDNNKYIRYSEYIETISSDYLYFGIHAVAHEGAYHLTIDDINIDMVKRYDMEVTPYRMDTTMMPGGRVSFHYKVQNTGYEELQIYMNGYTDFFTDIEFYSDGQNSSTFYTEPNQIVEAVCCATLSPEVEIGTLCWLDIMLTVSCDCVTSMTTIWATAGSNAVSTNEIKTGIYPNPSNGRVTIEGNGIVTITNALGQEILKTEVIEKEIFTLEKGIYFVKIDNGPTQKIIVE